MSILLIYSTIYADVGEWVDGWVYECQENADVILEWPQQGEERSYQLSSCDEKGGNDEGTPAQLTPAWRARGSGRDVLLLLITGAKAAVCRLLARGAEKLSQATVSNTKQYRFGGMSWSMKIDTKCKHNPNSAIQC